MAKLIEQLSCHIDDFDIEIDLVNEEGESILDKDGDPTHPKDEAPITYEMYRFKMEQLIGCLQEDLAEIVASIGN